MNNKEHVIKFRNGGSVTIDLKFRLINDVNSEPILRLITLIEKLQDSKTSRVKNAWQINSDENEKRN